MRGHVFTATEWWCRFHFTIYPGEFIWQRASERAGEAGRVRYCRWLRAVNAVKRMAGDVRRDAGV